MLGLIIAIVLLVVLVFGILLMSYVKAPPDMAYVISGIRKRVIIGRAGIRIPFLERVDKLNLQMMSVRLRLK
ncbi:MAG: flotillin [Eubacteriaceae bacterium]|nr:flotillin [Eubacteriaceae bacterium]